mmetsp:Transcript_21215/g.36219  ORF Transcript_21215/g.36219 Transcript_21215/m.36219 type:complete len:231 (+) Transcript_21215:48-740(+)
MMRSGLLTGLLATSASAFVSPRLPVAQQVRPSHSAIALSNHDDTDHKAAAPADVLRNAAAIFAVTCGLLYPSDSFAMNESAFQSSTMTVAEVIRTMDFSLPSSYDTIVDVQADTKEELTEETIKSAAGTAKKASPKKEAAQKKEKKEAAPKKVAMTKAEREEAQARAKEEKAKEDAEKQLEIEAKIKADREKKIAARKAAQEEKEAAAAEKAEAAYVKDVKFVDTSMPTY